MTQIEIYRPGTPATLIASVSIDEYTVYSKILSGEHKIKSEFYTGSVIPLQIGDYIVYNSESFFINRLPDIEKINNSTFHYRIDFQSVLYDLNKKLFISSDGLCDFSYTGEPIDFITNIVANLNVTGSGWTVGTIDSGDSIGIDFDNDYCYAALTRVAEAFKMEYSLSGKIISLRNSVGTTKSYSFQYGRGLGLYKISRQQVINQNIITKCYGFGSTKNIPSGYRTRAKRLVFEDRYLSKNTALYGTIEGQFTDDNIFPQRTSTLTGVNMVFGINPIARVDKVTKNDTPADCIVGCNGYSYTMEWNTSETTTIEIFRSLHGNDFGEVNFNMISANEFTFTAQVPGMDFEAAFISTGAGTAENIVANVGGTGAKDFTPQTSYIVDSSINFDINDYLIEGTTAKIVFKSGDLSGIECEIWKYDHVNKRIYFNAYSDQDGYTMPFYNGGSPVIPAIGDSYTLVDISLPQSYIDTAEAALQAATQAFLDENCVPQVVYSCDFDPKYAASISLSLDAGDKVTIIDTDLGINSLIRVSGIEFPLVDPYAIKATIADFVPYTLQERLIQTSKNTKKETVFVDRRSAELARRNTLRQNQLKEMIFDPDGYFDPVNIKPISIETLNLTVGTKSINFRLSGVVIEPNHDGDENEIVISAGSLVHLQISIGGDYTWVIASPATFSSLTPATAYYLYAKCSKAALTGEWVLTTDKKLSDAGDGYYYFLCGVLFAVLEGYRNFEYMYGVTYINGSVITTGKIRSIDGLNYFDLDQNQIMMGNATSSLDWNVTADDTLTLKGALVQSPGGTTAPILVNRGAYNAGSTYYVGEQVTYDGSTWNWINATPAAGHTPEEGAYWTLASSGGIGATGPAIAYRGIFSASTTYNNNSLVRDVVKNGSTYYFYIGADNTAGAWNGANFQSVGSSWSSVATGLLLAERATIENLYVREFEGIAVPAGDLAGSVAATQVNVVDIYNITLTGTNGTANITINGVTVLVNFVSSLEQSAAYFVADNLSTFTGVAITNPGSAVISFSGPITSCSIATVSGNLSGSVAHPQTAVKRKDTITLTGTSGTANVLCDGVTRVATFFNSLTETAAGFAASYSALYLAGGVVLTSSSNTIIFESQTAGVNFTGNTTITNVVNPNQGSLKMVGNEIWENEQNDDSYGTVVINRKGYNGGVTRDRKTIIGNGRGGTLVQCSGNKAGGMDHGIIWLDGDRIRTLNIPTSSAGLSTGDIYRSGNDLKIV